MSDPRSRRVVMVIVTLMFIAGMWGVLAEPGHACGKCGPCNRCCAPYTYASWSKVSVCSGCVYEAYPQICAPAGWRCPACSSACCKPRCPTRDCCYMPMARPVQIAVGQGQPESVYALRVYNDVLVPVRQVAGMLGGSVQYRGWGVADVTLGEKTVTLRQSCYPRWGATSVAGACMVSCKMHMPLSGLAKQLGVTVEKQDGVWRLTQ